MKVAWDAEVREGLPHDILAAAERLIVVAEAPRDAARSTRVADSMALVRMKEGGTFMAYAVLSAL
ncbi:hypothetical protein UB46_39850 [Burkholderiaceae bacterium 16]|nr:hypothetical protein UB46_39850 [Burkholderiaceae bacterium 16]